MKKTLASAMLISSMVTIAFAQTPADRPLRIGDVTISGSVRTRVETWNWFKGDANNLYTFPGSILRVSLSQPARKFDWQLELAVPILVGLPDDAVAPGDQGPQGHGANCYVANQKNRNAAMVFANQGYIRFKALAGVEGQTLKLGRMEFFEGLEFMPENATLAFLKRDRIANRLIGNSGFSHVGRSFDGVQYSVDRSKLNLTLFAARPTRGVYQVDGWGELNVNVFYGTLTADVGGKKSAGEWRVFGLGYEDYRDGVLKTDNRPDAARKADQAHINIGTFGGHYLHAFETRAGTFDVLAWGAFQAGSWGNLRQRGEAFAVEGGWQPAVLPRLQPWLRAGIDYGSGDKNANDSTHGSFFQILPSARKYARFPFFNMMNTRDVFGELILRPSNKLIIRSEAHSLRLANRNDRWYSGVGAFQPWTFGYTGRPSNGQSSLANLFDTSADFDVNAHLAVGAYYGYADGKAVIQALYPEGKNGHFGYLQLSIKF